MSYQVLARKYRPQRFEDVVGQRHVTQTLQNALEQKRMHHAYLFTGARGIGKTTVARILAKALNCAKGIGKEPCNQCGPCTEILEGKSLDVQEIDGASNTGVDDVRQIREQTKYLPAGGRYKVYIIDEVHMLSTQAFNALLKTLEEPPPHVIFIFATTEAHKIPSTILSRCQRYDFKRITSRELAASLEKIAATEGVACSPEALHLIAHEAQGSLRDAESLLDQAIAFAGKKIECEHLQTMLGFLDRKQLWNLLEALLKKDRKTAMEQLELFYQSGADLIKVAEDLFENFKTLLLIRSLNAVPDWIDLPKEELEKLQALSTLATTEELDQLVELGYRGFEEIARSNTPKMLLEVLLIRMTLVSEVVPLNQVLEKLERLATLPNPPPQGGREITGVSPNLSLSPCGRGQGEGFKSSKTWEQFATWIETQKPQLAAILKNGRLLSFEPKVVTLGFEADSIYGEMLKEEDRQKLFKDFLVKFFGPDFNFKLSTLAGPSTATSADEKKTKENNLKRVALTHESVKEAANILGAVVEEVRTK